MFFTLYHFDRYFQASSPSNVGDNFVVLWKKIHFSIPCWRKNNDLLLDMMNFNLKKWTKTNENINRRLTRRIMHLIFLWFSFFETSEEIWWLTDDWKHLQDFVWTSFHFKIISLKITWFKNKIRSHSIKQSPVQMFQVSVLAF